MDELDYGYEFDVSYNPIIQEDIIIIDIGDTNIYLTNKDLDILKEYLNEQS